MSAQFSAANAEYVANFGDKASLGLPPAKKLIVGPSIAERTILHAIDTYSIFTVTCMDARLECLISFCSHGTCQLTLSFSPAAHLGIKEGDAHVIRNAGGSAYVSPFQRYDSGFH
jgi:carbonic anhydrase